MDVFLRTTIAGDPEGREPIFIDGFLLFEIRTRVGTNIFFIGRAEAVTYLGRRVKRYGPPGTKQIIDLTPELRLTKRAMGTDVELIIHALDYGGVGGMSDIYLVATDLLAD